MKLSQRKVWLLGGIIIGVILLMTLFIAPSHNRLNSGSTYNRFADGYGAWYAFMEKRGTPLQRWQKPFENLAHHPELKHNITLLKINSTLGNSAIYEQKNWEEKNWVSRGNTLVIVGIRQPATHAAFSTLHSSPSGDIKIETSRRSANLDHSILKDEFGAIVWEEKIGKGRVIFVTTPHLAANAYQDVSGNFEFLAQLVTQSGEVEKEINASSPMAGLNPTIFVDEYIHGYKDTDIIEQENQQGILSYLAKTPLLPILVQGFILLAVAILAGNRRFGQPLTLSVPVIDNSTAYMEALAGVLHKANSNEFVVKLIAQEEQRQLQKVLGLGEALLETQSLVHAWVQQTGNPAAELEKVLEFPSKKRQITETDLLLWLEKWQQIKSQTKLGMKG